MQNYLRISKKSSNFALAKWRGGDGSVCYSSGYRPPAYEFWGTHSPKQAPSEYILRLSE